MTDYRRPTAADAPALDALFRASFAATFGHLYTPANLAAFFAKFTPEAWAEDLATLDFQVAEQDGVLLGFAKVGPLTLPATPTGHAMELRQLYLADTAKGTGVAQELMAWVLATARARGADELWLSVYIDNHRARRFYERHGFVDMGPYAFMVGDHADEDRLMRLVL